MIELSNCPNCAETDKITIAGKVFCAKCGTPSDQPSTPQTTNDAAVVASSTPMTPPVATQDYPSVQKFQTAPPTQPATPPPAPVEPPQPTPEPQTPSTDVPVQTPAPPPVTEPRPTIEPAQDTQKLDDKINSLSQTPTVKSDSTPEPEQPAAPDPVAPLAGLATSTEAPIAPAPATATIPSAPPAGNPTGSMADIKPVSRVSEHLGSEIMSLDKKDNAVFSGDQLNELAKITTEPPQPNAVTVPESHNQPAEAAEPEPEVKISQAPIAKSPVSTATTQDIKPPTPQAEPPKTDIAKVVEKSADNNAQEEPKSNFSTKTKKGLKPASIALTIVALFLVGAYIWQVNYPSLAFKIASAKAGVSASLPGYVPSGWKMLGDISTNPGTVSYALASPDNSKKISITQTKTDWDSQALAENYVAPKAENYLALQAQGLTIYVYGHNQAAWVNKGTWYKIETTDQSLSQDQIIKIATSL